jgi:putative MATE family efflux protein
MTHGPLLGNILRFSLPLMASNILQLLSNAVDMVIVGRFAGHASLAAVGSTSCIIYLMINLLIGISVGVNVVLARYLGETGRERMISLALHTAIVVAMAGGVLFGGVGILLSGWMLDLVKAPLDVRPLSLTYLHIYFLGTPFIMLYNYGAAALRAAGDTRHPLLFLSIGGAVNVILNLVFVVFLQMDVAGVAWATTISQVVNAGLILLYLTCSKGPVRISWKELRLDPGSFLAMARIGIPAGLQSCLFSLSNVVIQGAVNSYGSVIMAGCSAGENIENFLYVSMNSFHQACQTFTSQNLGAGRQDRIRRIVRTCLSCTVVLGIMQSAAVVIFSKPLISIYNGDPAVIQAGAERLAWVSTFYVIFGISDVLVGAIRGFGISLAPVVINLLGTCVFRLIWIHFLDTSTGDVTKVYVSYPISWCLIAAALGVFWIRLRNREQAGSLLRE